MPTETWLTPPKTLKILNYTIHGKDGPTSDTNKLRGGVLIVIRNSIPSENILQPASPNIEFLSIRTKTTPSITVGATYAPPKTKMSFSDLDLIIPHNGLGHYIIDGDFNAKHHIWNNPRKNRNGSTIKNHAELRNYPQFNLHPQAT